MNKKTIILLLLIIVLLAFFSVKSDYADCIHSTKNYTNCLSKDFRTNEKIKHIGAVLYIKDKSDIIDMEDDK